MKSLRGGRYDRRLRAQAAASPDDMKEQENENNRLASEIVDYSALKVLILSGSSLRSTELTCIVSCLNLQKLDISSNGLAEIPSILTFDKLPQLRILYMHNNLIERFDSLSNILSSKSLRYLTLFNNPIANAKGSLRHFIVTSILSLYALDFNVIADEERMEKALNTTRYQAFSPQTRLAWPLVQVSAQSAEEYLNVMHLEIEEIRRVYIANSPCLFIQRVWRGYLSRKQQSSQASLLAQNAQRKSLDGQRSPLSLLSQSVEEPTSIREQNLRTILRARGKEFLLGDNKAYRHMNLIVKLREQVKRLVETFRDKKRRIVAARIVFKALKRWHCFLQTNVQLYFTLNHYSSPSSDSCSVYYLTSQLPLFDQILAASGRFLPSPPLLQVNSASNPPPPTHTPECITSIRVWEDQSEYFYSKFPLIPLLRPALTSKVIISAKRIQDASTEFSRRFRSVVKIPRQQTKRLKEQKKLSQIEKEKLARLKAKLEQLRVNKYCSIQVSVLKSKDYLIAFIKAMIIKNLRHYLKMPADEVRNKQVVGDEDDDGKHQQLSSSRSSSLSDESQQAERWQFPSVSLREMLEKNQEKNFFLSSVFMMFKYSLLIEVSSALKIQTAWRGFAWKKQQPQPFCGFFKIQRGRACEFIQRWVRRWRWQHSRFFREKLVEYERCITDATLYIPLAVYQNIKGIVEATKESGVRLYEAEKNIILVEHDRKAVYLWRDENKLKLRGVLPMQVRRRKSEEELQQPSSPDNSRKRKQGDVMHLLHVGSKVSFVEGTWKLIKLIFQSVEEAKARAAGLALLTHRVKMNGSFIRLLTNDDITSKHRLSRELSLIKDVYGIAIECETLPQLQEKLIYKEQVIAGGSAVFLSSSGSVHTERFLLTAKESDLPLSGVEVKMFQDVRYQKRSKSLNSYQKLPINKNGPKVVAYAKQPKKLISEIVVVWSADIYLSKVNEDEIFPWQSPASPVAANIQHRGGGFSDTGFLRKKSGVKLHVQQDKRRVRDSDEKKKTAEQLQRQLKEREAESLYLKKESVKEQRSKVIAAKELSFIEKSAALEKKKYEVTRERRSLTTQNIFEKENELRAKQTIVSSIRGSLITGSAKTAETEEDEAILLRFEQGSRMIIRQITSYEQMRARENMTTQQRERINSASSAHSKRLTSAVRVNTESGSGGGEEILPQSATAFSLYSHPQSQEGQRQNTSSSVTIKQQLIQVPSEILPHQHFRLSSQQSQSTQLQATRTALRVMRLPSLHPKNMQLPSFPSNQSFSNRSASQKSSSGRSNYAQPFIDNDKNPKENVTFVQGGKDDVRGASSFATYPSRQPTRSLYVEELYPLAKNMGNNIFDFNPVIKRP